MIKLSERKWEYEQDLFVGKHRGYKYIIKRMDNLGHLCGYVRLTKNDELFGVNIYDNEIPLQVHGGITYGSPGNTLDYSSDKRYFYIGFDTAHGGDVSPYMVDFLKEMPSYGTYKDLTYVRKNCKKLINQIKDNRK